MNNNDLAVRDLDAGVPVASLATTAGKVSIGEILNNAIERGIPTEAMEKIVALYERMADREASQEFSDAMARFQASCPPIVKGSTANITTKSGIKYSYKYAELDTIARHIAPHLQACGLSYTWDSEMKEGYLVCTCTVRHARGHRESAKFGCPTDTAAQMSAAQQNGAALTYARRQALIQALGLTTGEPDPDGDDHKPVGPVAKITEHQGAIIDVMINDVGADRAKFLSWLKVERISDIPAASYKRAIAGLEEKRKA